jgi:predicted transcriptional regulator
MLHSFVGAVSTAYGYTQDLNESLNSIRIVTGKSTEDMARFAEEANKAAKELSTTTTDYTDASLIYYQQGLDDATVRARTDVTIKLANAAGESAEKAS